MKIFLDTIGCRLNQAEIEHMARQFRLAGHEIIASAAEADLAVINTCTVTGEAASDSRASIRRAQRQGAKQVIATGCWASLEPGAAAALRGVSAVIPNLEKDDLPLHVLNLTPDVLPLAAVHRQPLPGPRSRTRAFLKVQDGCDNACTYCITTLARGASRSIPARAVLADAVAALAGGAQELVLTGVHLGAWGLDLFPARHLSNLVEFLLQECAPPRLRLSSLEPWDLDADFFHLWQDKRLCPHLHLPLQSGSAGVLHRMARKTSPPGYAALVASARQAIPGIALTTDLIAGFPGESETEAAESLAFVEQMEFAGGHVFPYSPRPGTAAARLPGQLPRPVARQRAAHLREALAISARRYRQGFLGQTLGVLWESAQPAGEGGYLLEGLTGNYLRLTARSPEPRWNIIDQVRLDHLDADGLSGEIVSFGEPA